MKYITLSVIIIIILLIGVYVGYKNDVFVKAGIIIENTNNKISWSTKNNNIGDGYFILYRNNKEIYRGNTQEYIDKLMEDKKAPQGVKQVSIIYDKDSIKFTWAASEDKGTLSKYYVILVDNSGKKLLRSKKIKFNFVSGVAKYMLSVGTKKFETSSNSLSINKADIEQGVLQTRIIALDNSYNISKIKRLPSIRNFKFEVVDSKLDLRVTNYDTEQDYTYKIFINDKEFKLDKSNFNYKEAFKDVNAPQMPDMLYTLNDDYIVFYWEQIKDKGTSYKFYVEGTGVKFKNKVYSSELYKNTITDKVGYYYKINQDKDYKVSNQDELVEGNDITLRNLKDGTYYFHTAAVDENSNLSETLSYEFKYISNEKLKSLDYLFTKDDNFDIERYKLEKRYFARLPESIINRIEKNNIKIHFTHTNLTDVIIKETGHYIPGYILGLYYNNTKKILVNNRNSTCIVLHEIGHFIDYNLTSQKYYSSKQEFIDIYNKERTKLYDINSYPCSSVGEYFAEVFSDYFIIPSMKYKAPLTFGYIDKIVKEIEKTQ